MVNHKESITSYQASAIIANTTLGASMMILPRAMAQAAATPDGWIALLLMSGIYIVFIFANVLMMKKSPSPLTMIIRTRGLASGSVPLLTCSLLFIFSALPAMKCGLCRKW